MKEDEAKTGVRSDAVVAAGDVSGGAVGVLSPLATVQARARIAIAGRAKRRLPPTIRYRSRNWTRAAERRLNRLRIRAVSAP